MILARFEADVLMSSLKLHGFAGKIIKPPSFMVKLNSPLQRRDVKIADDDHVHRVVGDAHPFKCRS